MDEISSSVSEASRRCTEYDTELTRCKSRNRQADEPVIFLKFVYHARAFRDLGTRATRAVDSRQISRSPSQYFRHRRDATLVTSARSAVRETLLAQLPQHRSDRICGADREKSTGRQGIPVHMAVVQLQNALFRPPFNVNDASLTGQTVDRDTGRIDIYWIQLGVSLVACFHGRLKFIGLSEVSVGCSWAVGVNW